MALVSDAGTPLISDPGYRLVVEASAAGHRVVPLPGASAVMAALVVAGLPTDRFLFAGFLPPKSAARVKRLQEFVPVAATLVFYESGPRLAGALADMAAGPGHARRGGGARTHPRRSRRCDAARSRGLPPSLATSRRRAARSSWWSAPPGEAVTSAEDADRLLLSLLAEKPVARRPPRPRR